MDERENLGERKNSEWNEFRERSLDRNFKVYQIPRKQFVRGRSFTKFVDFQISLKFHFPFFFLHFSKFLLDSRDLSSHSTTHQISSTTSGSSAYWQIERLPTWVVTFSKPIPYSSSPITTFSTGSITSRCCSSSSMGVYILTAPGLTSTSGIPFEIHYNSRHIYLLSQFLKVALVLDFFFSFLIPSKCRILLMWYLSTEVR